MEQEQTETPPVWSEIRPPKVWARAFGYTTKTLRRWSDGGRIKIDRISTRAWRIALADLPAHLRA